MLQILNSPNVEISTYKSAKLAEHRKIMNLNTACVQQSQSSKTLVSSATTAVVNKSCCMNNNSDHRKSLTTTVVAAAAAISTATRPLDQNRNSNQYFQTNEFQNNGQRRHTTVDGHRSLLQSTETSTNGLFQQCSKHDSLKIKKQLTCSNQCPSQSHHHHHHHQEKSSKKPNNDQHQVSKTNSSLLMPILNRKTQNGIENCKKPSSSSGPTIVSTPKGGVCNFENKTKLKILEKSSSFCSQQQQQHQPKVELSKQESKDGGIETSSLMSSKNINCNSNKSTLTKNDSMFTSSVTVRTALEELDLLISNSKKLNEKRIQLENRINNNNNLLLINNNNNNNNTQGSKSSISFNSLLKQNANNNTNTITNNNNINSIDSFNKSFNDSSDKKKPTSATTTIINTKFDNIRVFELSDNETLNNIGGNLTNTTNNNNRDLHLKKAISTPQLDLDLCPNKKSTTDNKKNSIIVPLSLPIPNLENLNKQANLASTTILVAQHQQNIKNKAVDNNKEIKTIRKIEKNSSPPTPPCVKSSSNKQQQQQSSCPLPSSKMSKEPSSKIIIKENCNKQQCSSGTEIENNDIFDRHIHYQYNNNKNNNNNNNSTNEGMTKEEESTFVTKSDENKKSENIKDEVILLKSSSHSNKANNECIVQDQDSALVNKTYNKHELNTDELGESGACKVGVDCGKSDTTSNNNNNICERESSSVLNYDTCHQPVSQMRQGESSAELAPSSQQQQQSQTVNNSNKSSKSSMMKNVNKTIYNLSNGINCTVSKTGALDNNNNNGLPLSATVLTPSVRIFKTSIYVGIEFTSNDITVQLIEDHKNANVKKLFIHCFRVEPITSTPNSPLVVCPNNKLNNNDISKMDSSNFLRKEIQRHITLPTNVNINTLESYLENGYLIFKCLLNPEPLPTPPPPLYSNNSVKTPNRNSTCIVGSTECNKTNKSNRKCDFGTCEYKLKNRESIEDQNIIFENPLYNENNKNNKKCNRSSSGGGCNKNSLDLMYNFFTNTKNKNGNIASGDDQDDLLVRKEITAAASSPNKLIIRKKGTAKTEVNSISSKDETEQETIMKKKKIVFLNEDGSNNYQQQQHNSRSSQQARSSSAIKSVRFDMNNRTFKINNENVENGTDQNKNNNNILNHLYDNNTSNISLNNNDNTTISTISTAPLNVNSETNNKYYQHRSSSTAALLTTTPQPTPSISANNNSCRTSSKSRSPEKSKSHHHHHSHRKQHQSLHDYHRRRASVNSSTLSNHHHSHSISNPSLNNLEMTPKRRLSSDMIQDGFSCITKDGLDNVFLTYFFKLPSCQPSDRTQVRIENHSILKLKIIQEKSFPTSSNTSNTISTNNMSTSTKNKSSKKSSCSKKNKNKKKKNSSKKKKKKKKEKQQRHITITTSSTNNNKSRKQEDNKENNSQSCSQLSSPSMSIYSCSQASTSAAMNTSDGTDNSDTTKSSNRSCSQSSSSSSTTSSSENSKMNNSCSLSTSSLLSSSIESFSAIPGLDNEDDSANIMLREFSRRCRLPNNLFRFDEKNVTVSFVSNIWVRVEIPILEFYDTTTEDTKMKKCKKKQQKQENEEIFLSESGTAKANTVTCNTNNNSENHFKNSEFFLKKEIVKNCKRTLPIYTMCEKIMKNNQQLLMTSSPKNTATIVNVKCNNKNGEMMSGSEDTASSITINNNNNTCCSSLKMEQCVSICEDNNNNNNSSNYEVIFK